ncbi:MAG: putative bifunctional diguanylate cyclase/phosphodiesterase [Myxococcota bacterium]
MGDSRDDPGESRREAEEDTGVRVRREAAAVAVGGAWQRVFERLTEHSRDAIAVLTPTWRFRVLGGAVGDVLSCSVDELRTRAFIDQVHPGDRDRVARVLAEAQGSTGTIHTVDYRWRTRGGAYVDVRSTVVHREDEPAIDGLVMTTRRHGLPAAASDPVLPDRSAFVAAIGRAAAASERGFTVLVVEVGDHPQLAVALGDGPARKLVSYVGRRIRGAVNRRDLVAQVGVERFAVLLGGVQDEERVRAVANRLRERLRQPFHVTGQELMIGIAIGFATSAGDDGVPERVLASAEAAARRAGPSRPRAFHTPMRIDVQRRIRLAAALPRAFQRSEFQIRYQPIVRIADEVVTGFEALVRWMHPELGTIPPNEFIPLAEQLDWVVRLDRWMLEEASRRVSAWSAASSFYLAVNVSARHLDDPSLVPTVAAALSGSGLPPGRLRLEVTETAVANDTQQSIGALRQLRSLGVGIAIDDFGTGYASLASLADMPFDVLKVDMSFVRKLDKKQSRGVVQNIVSMAHDLGLEVVAEGVETRAQLDILRGMGCDHAQGYLFAKPLDARQARSKL